MIPEFGQSPLCLELDLDSYEESWTHVAAFRGQSGWLLMAQASIQSEHDILRAKLVVACDMHENPIPSWRAANLTKCHWGRLDHCEEEPPTILDDLLCEEEGAFYARWQREMNVGIAALHQQAQRNLAALEANAAALIRTIDFHIADLRRRRRMLEVAAEARAIFADTIIELESARDAAIARLVRQRTALRRDADASEEALWQRNDVLIEVEPVCLVRWRAKSFETAARLLEPEREASGGISLLAYQLAQPRLLAEQRAREALEAERRAEKQRERQRERETLALEKKRQKDLLKAAAKQARLVGRKADLSKAAPIVPAPPRQQPIAISPPAHFGNGELHNERDCLAALRDGLVAEGRKFLPGSPKFMRNQAVRRKHDERIAALNARIEVLAPVPIALPLDQPSPWTEERVDMLRGLWLTGVSAGDIGRAIGGVSRKAVIGKAKRLGLAMRAITEMPARQSTENKIAAES